MQSDQERKSVQVVASNDLQKTYAQLNEYEPTFQGIIPQFWENGGGLIAITLTVIPTFVLGISAEVTAAESLAWLTALPAAALTSLTSGAVIVKRHRYRHHLQKKKTIEKVVTEVKKIFKAQYELKVLSTSRNKTILYEIAESILTNTTYNPWAAWHENKKFVDEYFKSYDYWGDFDGKLLSVKNIRTHKELSVGAVYNKVNGKITLVVNGTGKLLLPKSTSQPIELKTSAPAASAPAHEPQLPELNTDQFDFSSFPNALQNDLEKTLALYRNLRESELTVEEAYKAERVVEDLQNAANWYQTVVRFNGTDAEGTVGNILEQLHAELQVIADGQLAAAVRSLHEQSIYVESRKEGS